MNVFQAAILGILQGLAEFLPISSSGHLELAQQMMGLTDNSQAMLLLSVLLHAGTLVAVVVVFWEDWWNILKNPFKSKTLGLLFIASLPALAAALLLDVDQLFGSGFLGIAFIITGLFLLLAEKLSKRGKHAAGKDQMDVKRALAMGAMQAVALMPGVSRSGSTLLGGVASGLSRKTAAKFSFMMSAPAIVGSLLMEGKDALESGAFDFLSANLIPIIVGVLLSAISGYLAIRYMLKLINKISFGWFALYVFILGAVVIVLQLTGVGGLPAISFPFMN
ncbi:MAG: undecaprenyl-diphosphate phosphatase [Clostridiales bacterium]|nr:undecaprenyl-diphosphate phosphatase [Clostridiales bacterium]